MNAWHSLMKAFAASALIATFAAPAGLLAIVAPEVFNEKAEKSKLKAVAVTTGVRTVEEKDGIERRLVSFKLEKRVSEGAAPEEFDGFCQTVVNGKPKLGESLYFNPVKGQRYFVTLGENNELTSLTPMTPRLMNAIVKTPDKIKYRIGAAYVDDGADQHYEKAEESFNKKDYRQAIVEANKTIQICNVYDRAFNLRGRIFMESEKYDSAEEDFNKALVINPDFMDAYYQRGICKNNQRRYESAIEDFSKVIDNDPKDLQALYCRATAWKYSGNLDKASADYKRIEEVDKNNHAVSRQIAFIDYEKGDMPAAEKQFAKTLELNPSDLYCAIFLNIAQQKQRKPGSAAASSEKLKAINDWPAPALKMFAGKLAPAACVEAASSTKPGEQWMLSGALFYAGEKLLLDGDEDGAAVFFKKCLDTKDVKSLEYLYAKKELDALLKKRK